MDRESQGTKVAAARLGRKAQIGGSLAAFIGILLIVATRSAPANAPIDVHRMAATFIAIGVGLAATGTFARWYCLKSQPRGRSGCGNPGHRRGNRGGDDAPEWPEAEEPLPARIAPVGRESEETLHEHEGARFHAVARDVFQIEISAARAVRIV